MDLTTRPPVIAGIAVISAAVLAAGPIAQQLPDLSSGPASARQVSVSDINLTGAADSVVDLFAGVENELASLAGGAAAAAAVPAGALTDFINPAALPLPAATWVNTLQTAGTNLQTLYNAWSVVPFPILQQVAANWVQYGNLYVGPWQSFANTLYGFYTGTANNDFIPLLQIAFTNFIAGKVSTGITDLYTAFVSHAIVSPATGLESILNIPQDITASLAAGTKSFNSGVTTLGTEVTSMLNVTQLAFGASLQAAYNSWQAGDQMGALTNLLNTPGATTNGFLNGSSGLSGLLSSRLGVLQTVVKNVQNLATAIPAPGAAKVMSGGSLSAAFQGFLNQLISGWPQPTQTGLSYLGNGLLNLANEVGVYAGGQLASQLTGMLQSIPSVLSSLPSALSNLAGTVATQIGSWIAAILRLL